MGFIHNVMLPVMGKYLPQKAYLALQLLYRYPASLRLRKAFNPTSTHYGLYSGTERSHPPITVSFTTYPKRIQSSVYVADAMLRQTYKPDRVILVLCRKEFQGTTLPKEYENLKKRGLTILWVDEELRHYGKIYYALRDYPDGITISVDDDYYYSDNMIEILMSSYYKHPTSVSYFSGAIFFYKNGEWHGKELERDNKQKPNIIATPEGLGGILYPPHCLYKDALDVNKFVRLSFGQDDLWLYAMEVLNDTHAVKAVPYFPLSKFVPIHGSQLTASCLHDNRPELCKRIFENLCIEYPKFKHVLYAISDAYLAGSFNNDSWSAFRIDMDEKYDPEDTHSPPT